MFRNKVHLFLVISFMKFYISFVFIFSTAKLSPEELELRENFQDFESSLFDILHILEYWDRKYGNIIKVI